MAVPFPLPRLRLVSRVSPACLPWRWPDVADGVRALLRAQAVAEMEAALASVPAQTGLLDGLLNMGS